jgi:hypothetical protein
MKQKTLAQGLKDLKACSAAIIWAETQSDVSFEQAWNNCPKGSWLRWLFYAAYAAAYDIAYVADAYVAAVAYDVADADVAAAIAIRKLFPVPTAAILALFEEGKTD